MGEDAWAYGVQLGLKVQSELPLVSGYNTTP